MGSSRAKEGRRKSMAEMQGIDQARHEAPVADAKKINRQTLDAVSAGGAGAG